MNDLLRILIALALLLHGLSHIIWFLAAWTPYKLGIEDGPWVLPGGVTLTSLVGRIIGLIALVAMVLLMLGGIALLAEQEWWRGAARMGVFLSFAVVLPWWPRIPHHIGLQAIIVDIVLMFIIALPLSLEIIPAA